MIHTNRCKHCGKTKAKHHKVTKGCRIDNVKASSEYAYSFYQTFYDSGLAALDAHKEELYEAANALIKALTSEIHFASIQRKHELKSILNQIEKEK